MKKRKFFVRVLYCIFTLTFACITFGSCESVKDTSTQQSEQTSTVNLQIKEWSPFEKKLQGDFSAYMPPDDVISMGGCGIQIFSERGAYIGNDVKLDATKAGNYFFRLTWLEKNNGRVTLLILKDNVPVPFSVDSKEQAIAYTFDMQSTSVVNIPISIGTLSSKSDSCEVSFLLLYNNPLLVGADEQIDESNTTKSPNKVNCLTFAASCKKEENYKIPEVLADERIYINQNDTNTQLAETGLLYSYLSDKEESHLTFQSDFSYIDLYTLNTGNPLYLYLMGKGEGKAFVLLNNKLVDVFDSAYYLKYSLDSSKYLKYRLDLNTASLKDGDEIKILFITEGEKKEYKVLAKKLNVSR